MDNSTEIIYQLKDRIESLQSNNKDDYISFISTIVNYKLSEVFEKMLMNQLIHKFQNVMKKLIKKAEIEDERTRQYHKCTYQNKQVYASKIDCCPLHFEEIIGFRSDIIQLEYTKLKKYRYQYT